MTEGEGEVSTLGSIHLERHRLHPFWILESMESGIRVEVTSKDRYVVCKGS